MKYCWRFRLSSRRCWVWPARSEPRKTSTWNLFGWGLSFLGAGGSATATATNQTAAPTNRPPGPCPEQSVKSMTLAELEAMAEQNNPTLAQAAARVQAVRGEWLQAGLYPNPRRLSGHRDRRRRAGRPAGGVSARRSSPPASCNSPATWPAKPSSRPNGPGRRSANGRANDVRRAFYDVLVAQRSVELTDQLVRIGQEGVRAAEALLRAKEVSRVDVLQARIEADSARILAEKARNRHLAAWRNLAVVAGVADMQPAPLAGELQDGLAQLTWDDALDRAVGREPRAGRGPRGRCPGRGRRSAASVPSGCPTSTCRPACSTTTPPATRSPRFRWACPCRCSIATRGTFARPRPS